LANGTPQSRTYMHASSLRKDEFQYIPKAQTKGTQKPKLQAALF